MAKKRHTPEQVINKLREAVSSTSSVENEKIVMSWVAFQKNESSHLHSTVREGERWTFAPWGHEMISIPASRDFSLSVELGV